MSFPYNLKIYHFGHAGALYASNYNACCLAPKMQYRPIIRHISDLTKPITHKGETFVPTERLMWDESYVGSYHKDNINTNEATFSDVLKLIEWGFWPDMPEGEEVIYVTEDFNPYK